MSAAVQILSPTPVKEYQTHQLVKKTPQIWDEETAEICRSAAAFLTLRRRGRRDAVVFDVDGTLVADETHCILPVRILYDAALRQGYKIFIVTARPLTRGNQIFTALMLEKCGIEGYQSMFMRPSSEEHLYRYKVIRRQTIANLGFNTVMSVGDMPFDFGAYGGRAVEIPRLTTR